MTDTAIPPDLPLGTAGLAPGARLAALRASPPLVQQITNYVAMNVSANVLLALGASPAMVHAAEEAGEFAGLASALTVNIGTLSPPWVAGMEAAIAGARGAGRPWALDPVAAGATGYRREISARLVGLGPAAIRGNASEILALAGEGGAGRGADAGDPVAVAENAARRLSRATGAVTAVTGAVDFVTDGERAYRVGGGHALMPRITALGCALTGIVGAFLAGEGDRLEAVVAALAVFGVAGEAAGREAQGPGSFAVAFLDELAALSPEALDAGARIEAA